MTKTPSLKNLTSPNYGKPKDTQHLPMQDITRPHIESFNHMLREGLTRSVQEIPNVQYSLPNGQRVSMYIQDATIGTPMIAQGNVHSSNLKVYPSECRGRGSSYCSKIQVQVAWTVDNKRYGPEEKLIGEVPIMVKSSACNLHKLTPAQLVRHGEEAEEMGGYFVVNGNEKVLRMLIMPRRNYPLSINRPSWKNRGPHYTEYGVSMRCVKQDQTAANIVLHYLSSGAANLCFTYRKEQFFVPVILILKCVSDLTDHFIYQELIRGKEDDSFYKGCIANMLRQAQEEGLSEKKKVMSFMGKRFRIKLSLPEWYTDIEVADYLITHCICIHLDDRTDRFNCLVYMIRKLFSFAKGQSAAESADNPMFQEVLLAGHLYQMTLKEKIENWLISVKQSVERTSKAKGSDYTLDTNAFNDACRHTVNVSKPMEYLMATGNLVSKTGLGLMQTSGLAVVADKLNFYRYLSHFRCIHRGAFFAEMRTTSVRRLLPEAWGFICPVHTPDGSPCGLMNHMTATCQIVNMMPTTGHIPRLLAQMGMVPHDSPSSLESFQSYSVLLDGKVIGWLPSSIAANIADQLRGMKVKGLGQISPMMEICLVPFTQVPSQYPGLYLFNNTARMMRPVKNLAFNMVEMIGTFEQVYLNICITPEESHKGITTHKELSEHSMLSILGNFTPFSDYNQSPRNMYQCQMGKQTMGTPCHSLSFRSDNKLYRIQTPQTALVRPYMYDHYDVDTYPLGTNATVAVISYTGYDMEDAMILNKSAFERGFGHGSVYKTEFIDLKEISKERYRISLMFGCKPGDPATEGILDKDGLPPVGTYLTEGDPYYSYINVQTGEVRVMKYKSAEPAYVDHIKILGNDLGTEELQKICVVLRVPRNPIIGDKFASRHGQKGICSQKWPVENMPFTETGMTPDILFNPHGFPSRMTIGMMIESMAGKSAAMHGLVHDATPFTYSEEEPPIDYFGKMLTSAGYNYYGTERMYSGIDGREFEADIFIGVVYYQRLRHMVSDKFQVRTTGPVDIVTHQPVKGRKRGGGIRFGEMERDALIAHGTSFLLHDRLFNCSDKSTANVCVVCGSLLSPLIEKASTFSTGVESRKWSCCSCGREDSIKQITVPYVFRYLVAELGAMNIKTTLDVKQQ